MKGKEREGGDGAGFISRDFTCTMADHCEAEEMVPSEPDDDLCAYGPYDMGEESAEIWVL